MSEKRKDKKGRIFRSGEGQRPNKTYFYRYHRNGEMKCTMSMPLRWRNFGKKKK